MIALSEILDTRCITLELSATRKKHVLEELVNLLVKAGKLNLPQPKKLAKELLAQEKLVSTGIGDGVAIPHKLVEYVPETVIAFGRKQDGLNFNALDCQPVYLVFLILGPDTKPIEHLQLLSKLSRLLRNDAFKKILLEAQAADEIIEALRREEAE
ncbi:PTS sugar transporter subunit IIA [candidate division KSB3 bacterium]|uniref:PTS sugar transporter subunit IIA n=1 Tax=candidate division KSB3 bacterium TaxID=2044937 RepID=A0A9D5JSJ1_9BACT|nr:PTS sugar transporter subunit IIA [candidate division KSB3 bacterium]MBD3323239.1 PTS sugar transporter subunit IIA [candidate division KSB3 bacterium]